MRRLKLARLPYWAGPMLFCLAWHFTALRSWFCDDDFAWLGLPLLINSWRDLPHVLFAPMAQGTIRVFSERLFFLTLGSLFDISVVPFKIVVFATQFANLALLTWLARRLTGSALAGFLASVIWCAGVALAEPLAWSSAYNEVLVAFCVLLGFYFRLQWIDTGERRYLYLEWLPYLFGFGVLETIVIYPALVLLFAFCCFKKTVKSTLPLFIPAIAFIIFHFTAIPPADDPKYKLVFRAGSILSSLWSYWALALGALRVEAPTVLSLTLVVVASVALLFFLALKLRQGKPLALFLLLWFPLALAPVLPLQSHITEYYLTVPCIGLAILAAWVAATPNRWTRAAALVVVSTYLFCSWDRVSRIEHARYDRGRSMRHLMRDMETHESEYEGKIVLLQNVEEGLFWAGLLDRPLSLLGIPNVYLAPGGAWPNWLHADYPDTSNYEISWQDAYDLVMHGRAVVFSLAGKPENTTAAYAKTLQLQRVLRVADVLNVGDPDAASRLGEGWHAPEGLTRWSKREASFWMESGRTGQRLYIRGFCPQKLLQAGPLELALEVEGQSMATFPIRQSNWFTFDAAIPAQLTGRGKLTFHLRVSRAYYDPNDKREFGLIFATFTVQK